MSIIRNVNQNVKEWIKNESIDYSNPMCLRVALAVALATPEINNILKSKKAIRALYEKANRI
jgi:hypothetical protein